MDFSWRHDLWYWSLRASPRDEGEVRGIVVRVPGEPGAGMRMGPAYTKRLEELIDQINESLEPLTSFILPGGTPLAAWLHLGRTVCRRAERLVCQLATIEGEQVNPEVVRYLNRLSDLLFVLARITNDGGRADILWSPGAGNK